MKRITRFIVASIAMLLTVDAAAQTNPGRVMTGVRFDGNTSVVSLVVAGGPADIAGIRVGDEILSIDDSWIVQSADLVKALSDKVPGDTVRIEVARLGKFRFFDLKLIDAVMGDVVIGEDGKAERAPAKMGVLGEIGPELTAESWFDLPEGVNAGLGNNRGKVICFVMFQADCEFSRKFGLPEFKKLQDHFEDDPDVLLMAVQTPFRNFENNTFGAAKEMFREFGLRGPMGHDGKNDLRSKTFGNYRALGTPWFVVLDKRGIVKYNDSSLPLQEAVHIFARLKEGKDFVQQPSAALVVPEGSENPGGNPGDDKTGNEKEQATNNKRSALKKMTPEGFIRIPRANRKSTDQPTDKPEGASKRKSNLDPG